MYAINQTDLLEIPSTIRTAHPKDVGGMLQCYHHSSNGRRRLYVVIEQYFQRSLERLCTSYIILPTVVGTTLHKLHYASNGRWKDFVDTALMF
ncbi:MAG: hypothetical protein WCJ03_06475 [Bacteroidales bacterium]